MDEIHSSISSSEQLDTRRLLCSVVLFVPLVLMVVAVNLFVDPAGLYRNVIGKYKSDEFRIAQVLAAGRSVVNVRPIDDRLLQKYIIENTAVAPDIVILGSSHSAWLGANIFQHQRVLNHSVITAALADYLGIFEGYAKRNLYPKRVILVLDPQLISVPVVSENWISIKEDTLGMLGRLGVHSARIKQPLLQRSWFNILSLSYFQRSLRQLQYQYAQGAHPADENILERQLLLSDGRSAWEGFLLLDAGKFDGKSAVRFEHGRNEEMIRQLKPDAQLEGILEKFIRYLTAAHLQVTLCLLPVRPDFYQSIIDQQRKTGNFDIEGIEQYYRSLARRLNLELIGSYDPAVGGLESKDFYDLDHVRNGVIERLFKQKGWAYSMSGIDLK